MQFEDLKAWQKSRELTNALYSMRREKPLFLEYSLRDQIQRAAVSTMNNLADGFDRIHKAEKFHLYNIAKGSDGEVKSICYVISDNRLASSNQAKKVQFLGGEVSSLIYGLIKSTKSVIPPLRNPPS